MIVKAAILFWWLIAAPLLAGALFLPLLPREKQRPAVLFFSGFLLQLALAEILAVGFTFLGSGYDFYVFVPVYGVLVCINAAAGLFVLVKRYRAGERLSLPERPDIESICYWVMFALVVGIQLYMAHTHASFDGDDAYYVAQSLSATETGAMYTREAYTGVTTAIDIRHALAAIPMWEAFLAATSGMHVTRLVHAVLPLYLIPLSYLFYGMTARLLLRKYKKGLPVFMVLLALLQMFGSVSIYTAERFLLTRTWQGKSLFANVLVPALLFLFAWLFAGKEEEDMDAGFPEGEKAAWLLLILAQVFAGMCTSIGMMLSAAFTFVCIAALAFYTRRARLMRRACCVLIPDVIYILLYLLL